MVQSQHVLVTGAGGDIGTAIVEEFLNDGATVTAVDIKSEGEILSRYSKAHQSKIRPVCLDLCDRDAVNDLIHSGAPLDAVVGNAGVGGTSPFVDIDVAFWQRTLDVNLTANFNLGQVAAKHFIKNKTAGRVLFRSPALVLAQFHGQKLLLIPSQRQDLRCWQSKWHASLLCMASG